MKTERQHMDSYAWCPLCGDAMVCSKELNKKKGWDYYCGGCNKEFEIIEKQRVIKDEDEKEM